MAKKKQQGKKRKIAKTKDTKKIGNPRTHANPVTIWQLYENALARRQYNDRNAIAIEFAKKGILLDVKAAGTQIRRNGGVAVKTAFGQTTTPHGIEVGTEYTRRKNIVISYLKNIRGLMAYYKTNKTKLDRGMTLEQRALVAQLDKWCSQTLQAALALEKRLKVDHI